MIALPVVVAGRTVVTGGGYVCSEIPTIRLIHAIDKVSK